MRVEWLRKVVSEVIAEEYLEDVCIDETSAHIVIDVYDQSEEIFTPEVAAQHCHDLDDDFFKSFLSEKDILRVKVKATVEYPLEVLRGYIGSLKDYINEKLWDMVEEKWWKEVEKEIEEWKRRESIRLHYRGYDIAIYPTVIEKECYVNIPHYHLYKGYRVWIPIVTLEENPSEEEVRLQTELLKFALNNV